MKESYPYDYEMALVHSEKPEEYQEVNYPQGYAGDARLYYREYDPEVEDGTMRIKVLDDQFFLSAEQAVRAMVVKYFGGFAIISDESKYDGGYPIAVSPGEGTIQNLLLESMWDNRASLPQMP